MKYPGVEIANLESSHLLGTWANHFISMSFSSTNKWKQLIEIHCESILTKVCKKKWYECKESKAVPVFVVIILQIV